MAIHRGWLERATRVGGASRMAPWGVALALCFAASCRSSDSEPAGSADADGSDTDVADAADVVDGSSDSLDATTQDGQGDALDVVVPDGVDAFNPDTAWRCRVPCADVGDCIHPEQSVCEGGLCRSDSYACVDDFDCYLAANKWLGTDENACEKDSDCKSGYACVDYEGQGFCTREYIDDDDCWLWRVKLKRYETGEPVIVCMFRALCIDPFFSEEGKYLHHLCVVACPDYGYSPDEPVCNEETGHWECTDESCPGKCLDGICRCTNDSHCPDTYHPKCVAGVCSCTADSCAELSELARCVELSFPDGKLVR